MPKRTVSARIPPKKCISTTEGETELINGDLFEESYRHIDGRHFLWEYQVPP